MSAPAPLDGAMEFPDQFVASFGKDAALGCFTADGPMPLSRRDRVLLRTPRGLEIGILLGPATLRQARLLGAQVHGELVRPLTHDDDDAVSEMATLAHRVMAEAERLVSEKGITLSLIDAEAFFDRRHALLHILHSHPDDLSSFMQTLSERTGLDVRLANLAIPAEPEPHGCGEPNCGSGEGGCSSCSTGGGCSTGCGTVQSAPPDLRPYFAHLRSQMESTQRVPLN